MSPETGQLKVFNNCFNDLRINIQNRSANYVNNKALKGFSLGQRAIEVFVARLRFEFLETSHDFEGIHFKVISHNIYLVNSYHWRNRLKAIRAARLVDHRNQSI